MRERVSMVIASAGAGKTERLSSQIINILKEPFQGKILAITFTRKAAREMRERVLKKLMEEKSLPTSLKKNLADSCILGDRRVETRTIDSFLASCVSTFSLHLDLPLEFTIMDEWEARNVWEESLKETLDKEENRKLLLDYVREIFTKEESFSNPLRIMEEVYQVKENMRIPKELLMEAESTWQKLKLSLKSDSLIFPHVRKAMGIIKFLLKVEEKYTQKKEREGKIDFLDLEGYTYRLLHGRGKISAQRLLYFYERLDRVINHLLIDEFQDTSLSQWKVLQPLLEEFLSSSGKTFFLVGDQKQAIYRFRGGEVGLMEKAKKKIERFGGKELYVKENFRFSYPLLDFINRLAGYLFEDYQPQHWKGEEVTSGYQITLVESKRDNLEDKRRWLRRILSPQGEILKNNFSWGDICILAPTHSQLEKIAKILREENIPYRTAKNIPLREIRGVRDFLNLFRWLTLKESFYLEAVKRSPLKEILSDLPPLTSTFSFLSQIYQKHWRYLVHSYPGEEMALLKLLEVCAESQEKGYYFFPGILKYFELKGDSLTLPSYGKNSVVLSTIHKAKGLTFPLTLVVLEKKRGRRGRRILWDSERNIFLVEPSQKEKKAIEEKEGEIVKFLKEEEKKELQDEKNLLYVAVTRGSRGVFIYVEGGYTQKKRKGYPFWEEILKASGKWEKVKEWWERRDRELIVGEGDFKPQPKESKKKVEKFAFSLYSPVSLPPCSCGKPSLIPSELPPLKVEEWQKIREGEEIHYLLSQIKFLDGVSPKEWVVQLCKGRMEKWKDTLEEILSDPQLHSFLYQDGKEKICYTELEIFGFLEGRRRTVKIDRLTLEDDIACILDYKMEEERKEFAEQLNLYEKAVREAFPKVRKVYKFLYFIRKKYLKKIE